MSRYFYSLDDQTRHGPVTLETLRALVVAGSLHAHHYVFVEGAPEWVEAKDVPGVFPPAGQSLGALPSPAKRPAATVPASPRPKLRRIDTGEYAALPKAGGMPLAHGLYGPPEPCPMRYRIGASLTDAAVGAGIMALALPPAYAVARALSGQTSLSPAAFWVTTLVCLAILPWLYHAGFECSPWGATPGKRALTMRVVDRASSRLTFRRATVRHFAKTLSILPLFLGLVWASFDPQRRAWHDVIAGTRVERTPPV